MIVVEKLCERCDTIINGLTCNYNVNIKKIKRRAHVNDMHHCRHTGKLYKSKIALVEQSVGRRVRAVKINAAPAMRT